MSSFYLDNFHDFRVDYEDLVKDVNLAQDLPLYLKSESYYDIFKTIIISLVHDIEICLLDSDFSEDEISKLVGEVDISKVVPVRRCSFESFSEILIRIKETKLWKLTLFTSGTTGLPKKVSHSFESLTRGCRVSEKHENDVWGYAFNPTHIAGIQVFFQALLNQNTLVRLFELSKEQVLNSIQTHEITHISATPTFLRLLSPTNSEFLTVSRITSGGEKFDLNLKTSLKELFPNAKLLNIYASTEAGNILVSDGECFIVGDKDRSLVKILDNELFLKGDLLGEGVEEKLIDGWYPTGDIVEIVDEGSPMRIRFVSRKNEMINVGGYKVNPSEVEQALSSYPKITDSIVYGKSNSVLGNILCADVICKEELVISELREFLLKKLQGFKIPRKIRVVDSIEKTRSGKKKR